METKTEKRELSSLNLFQKLAEVRTLISVKKEGKVNAGRTKYDYYQIEQVYSQAKAKFKEYGIFTYLKKMEYSTQKSVYECELVILNTDKPEEKFSQFLDIGKTVVGGASEGQMTGATQTYATKYLYLSLLMLDNGEDEDKKNIISKKQESIGKVINHGNIRQAVAKLVSQGKISSKEVFEILEDFNVKNVVELDFDQLKVFQERIIDKCNTNDQAYNDGANEV